MPEVAAMPEYVFPPPPVPSVAVAGTSARLRIAGDHGLPRGVQVRGNHDAPARRRSLGTQGLDLGTVEAEHGRHRPGTGLSGLVHQLTPPANQAGRVDRAQGSSGVIGTVLAQAVTGGADDGPQPPGYHGKDGRGVGQNGRLRIPGLEQLRLGAVPHDPRQGNPERLFDFQQHGPSGRKPFGQVARHADFLGPLAREDQNVSYHRITTAPQVKPAPNVTSRTIMPGLSRPSCSACASASGIDPDEVFP